MRAKDRAATLYSVGGPDHEAVIRFGGEAPRRRAGYVVTNPPLRAPHGEERQLDHARAR